MKNLEPLKNTPTRREPKTERGRVTRDEILTAARKLACERWVNEIPYKELAEVAGVARASLFHAYPNWDQVLLDLLEHELGHLDGSFDAACAQKRVRPGDRTYTMLVVLLDRAEQSGKLYANLRSRMFTWQGELRDGDHDREPMTPGVLGWYTLVPLRDQYGMVEELLGIPNDSSLKGNEYGPAPCGECLLNLAFDLAAGSPSQWSTFDERRVTLQRTIEVMAAGVKSRKPVKR